jgi:hypothetical protein
MMRPGFLGEYNGLGFGRYEGLGNNSLGFFGKGMPGGAPPPPPPPKFDATFKEGKWDCSSHPKPASDKDNYYHCCPSGWTKTPFNDTKPCKGKEGEKLICGPLPQGAKDSDVICCELLKQWLPGNDPAVCTQAALQSGRAIPGMEQTMLAEEIQAPPSIISPALLIGGGLAAAGLIVLTIFLR